MKMMIKLQTIYLILCSNDLISIPPEVGNLSKLKKFVLHHNNLTSWEI